MYFDAQYIYDSSKTDVKRIYVSYFVLTPTVGFASLTNPWRWAPFDWRVTLEAYALHSEDYTPYRQPNGIMGYCMLPEWPKRI
jgi:hypothetical protein